MDAMPVRAEEKLMMEESTVRVDEKDLCSSWVVEMEELLAATGLSMEAARGGKPSIYRVPEHIKNFTNRNAYRPCLVSLGPFHHGKPELFPMEKHKREAVLHLVKRSGKPLGDFVAAVQEVADELLDAYHGLDEKWRGASRGHFVQMMVMDGCFLLELMVDNGTEPDYANHVFSAHGNHVLWPGFRSDMIVMENQLPLLVLQRLLAVQRGTTPIDAKINEMVVRYLGYSSFQQGLGKLGLHPLDILHRSFCGPRALHESRLDSGSPEDSMSSAVELSEARIHFKKGNTGTINDIDFKNGVLSMPVITAYGDAETFFLNLLAYEQVHPDTGYEVLSYVAFVVDLIDSERDVALLRSKGLIKNFWGSDKEFAEMFNTVGKASLMHPSNKLNDVQQKVIAHCAKRRNKWRANFVHSYMSSPWVFISLVAAVILLIATLLQTVYTVLPYYIKS